LQSVLDDLDVLDITDPSKSYESSMSSSSSSERYAGYWVLIFDLVLRGKLDLVWQMLLSHPEIISRDDSQEVFELESIFESHPLLSDTKISASTSSAYRTGSAARDKSDEWLEWRQVSRIPLAPPPSPVSS
jgi:hypothetical protein